MYVCICSMYVCAHKCKGRVKVYNHSYTYLNV